MAVKEDGSCSEIYDYPYLPSVQDDPRIVEIMEASTFGWSLLLRCAPGASTTFVHCHRDNKLSLCLNIRECTGYSTCLG